MNQESLKRILNSQKQKGMGETPTGETAIGWEIIKNILEFPVHLFPKRGAETFDIRTSFALTPPTKTIVLIDWIIPSGAIGFWRFYSLFSDVPAGTTARWNFQVNGTEVFKFHGDSTLQFQKNLALGNDLTGEIDALQELKENDHIIVTGTISAAVNATIAARIKGWIVTDPTMQRMRTGG